MKKNTLKRILSGAMAVLMTATILPAQCIISSAANEPFNLTLKFNESDDEDVTIDNDTLSWDAKSDEEAEIKYECDWTNNEGSYDVGEVNFIFTRLGITRNTYMKPDSIAVPAGWNYEVSSEGVTTITNTSKIDMANASNGVFEFAYKLNPRQIKDIDSGKVMAAVKVKGNYGAYSNPIYFNYKSSPDKFKLKSEQKIAEVESTSLLGSDKEKYYWATYTDTVNLEKLMSREVSNFKLSITLPKDAELVAINNQTDYKWNKDGDTYDINFNQDDYYYLDNIKSEKSFNYLVRYSKDKFTGDSVVVSSKLSGIYIDSEEYITISEDTASGKLYDYKLKNEGELFKIESSRALNSVYSSNSWKRDKYSKFDVYLNAESKYSKDTYRLEMFSDYLEVKQNDGTYKEVKRDNQEYRTLTVQSLDYFTDSNNDVYNKLYIDVYGDDKLIDTVKVSDVKQQINLKNVHKVSLCINKLSGSLIIKSDALMLSGRVLSDITGTSVNHLFGLTAYDSNNNRINEVSKSAYSGTDADRIANRDINEYSAYIQRSITEIPVTEKNCTVLVSAAFNGNTIDDSAHMTKTNLVGSYQIGTPGEISKFSYYDILPKGMVYLDNIKYTTGERGLILKDGTKISNENINEYIKSNNITSIKVTENYKDSGRTKVAVLFSFGDNPICYDCDSDVYSTSDDIEISLDIGITKDTYDKYGAKYSNVIGFSVDDNVSYYANNEKDDGASSKISNTDLWKDVNENGDTSEVMTYDSCSITLTNPEAIQQGLIKTVSTDNNDYQTTEASTPLQLCNNSTYYYKLQLNSVYNDINNIVFYNMLLEDIKAGSTFNGFDIDYASSLGFNCVLYTTDKVSPGKIDSGDWVTYDKSTCDVTKVKGVAIDFGKTPALKIGASVYALVEMKSPEVVTESKVIDNNFSATTTILGYDTNPTSNITYVAMGVTDAPAITISKKARQPVYNAGDTAIFDIIVSNTGNTDLTSIKVSESMNCIYNVNSVETAGPDYLIDSLGVGKSFNMTVKVVIPTDTVNGTVLANTVTATETKYSLTAKDSDSITVKQKADIEVTKTTPKLIYSSGEEIVYQITINNTSKVDLTNVKVIEAIGGTFDAIDGVTVGDKLATIKSLPIGGKMVLTYRHKAEEVTTETVLKNTVDVKEENVGIGKSAMADVTIMPVVVPVPNVNKPSIAITKTSDKKEYKAGETITYTINITNNGNVDLVNITVKDLMDGGVFDSEIAGRVSDNEVCIKALKASDTVSLIYRYIIPNNTKDGVISNIAKATEAVNKLSVEAKADVEVISDIISAKITKTSDAKIVKVGKDAIFTIKVTNNGTVDLENLVVTECLDGEYTDYSNNINIEVDGKTATITKLESGCTETIKFRVKTDGIEIIKNKAILTSEKYGINDEATAKVEVSDAVSVPKTGDNTPITVFVVLAIVSLIGMIVIVLIGKRKLEDE